MFRFLRVSATLWQISLYLAARADFHHGLLAQLPRDETFLIEGFELFRILIVLAHVFL